MTDRVNAITVVLEKNMRADDAKQIVDAIMMVKGVLKASMNVTSMADYIAESRVSSEFRERILNALVVKP